VTAQFTGDAQTYHERYFERLDFTALIDRCLRSAAVDAGRAQRVLDIGSGSGASVLALCRLLPHADILASDISPQLLRMLAAFAASRGELRGRITALCFDLHRRVFRPESFDLVVGCAILHHLVDPRRALANVAASLRPGGRIVLVEPLESGSLTLVAMFATVLAALVRMGESGGRLAQFMRAMRLDIQSRLGPPVEKPWTRGLDDKWVFDEPYLMALAKDLGLAGVDVHPADPDLTHVYENAFRSLLADGGLADVPIPPAVVDAVRAFDRGIAPELKRELCPTGVIVFRR
jgi:SAM-dependent methyltransferase